MRHTLRLHKTLRTLGRPVIEQDVLPDQTLYPCRMVSLISDLPEAQWNKYMLSCLNTNEMRYFEEGRAVEVRRTRHATVPIKHGEPSVARITKYAGSYFGP